MKLKGKIVVVTGGGTGIGEAVAKLFAEEGAHVVITGRREEKLKAVSEAASSDAPIYYHVCDVVDRAQVKALVDWTTGKFGPIDILVNNAGLNIPARRLEELSPEDWDLIQQVNSTGAFNVIHAILPQMRERKDGVIINVSSIAGMRASILAGAAYSASKFAMTALSKLITLEEKNNGIRATVIYPGEVNTPILDDRPVLVSDEHKANILQPEDVAYAALMVATLHPRANVPDLVIKPTNAAFS